MMEASQDILRRVEKVEIDVAVLDSKSNRLHQDMKDVDRKVDSIESKVDETNIIARKTQTLVVTIPAVLAGLYTIIQIIKNVQIL